MTKEAFRKEIAAISEMACALRCKLEEISESCHEEWINSTDHEDEAFWYNAELLLIDQASDVSEIENIEENFNA